MISCIKLLGDGSHALSASGDRTIKLWDVEQQRAIISMAGHGREIFCCDTDRNDPSGVGGNLIISGGRDKTARVWDRRTGNCEHVLVGHTGTVVCLRFDDMLLATAGGYARADDNEQITGVDNSVRLWDLRMLSRSAGGQTPIVSMVDQYPNAHPPINQDGDPVLHVDIQPGVIVSAHADHAIRIWDCGL